MIATDHQLQDVFLSSANRIDWFRKTDFWLSMFSCAALFIAGFGGQKTRTTSIRTGRLDGCLNTSRSLPSAIRGTCQ